MICPICKRGKVGVGNAYVHCPAYRALVHMSHCVIDKCPYHQNKSSIDWCCYKKKKRGDAVGSSAKNGD